MKEFISKNRHILWVLYVPVYFICFFLLEQRTDVDFNIIHCSLDDKIPFIEYFIIPYYLWFAYVAVTVVLFALFDVPGFKKLVPYLVLGMTIFLIVSAVYPNMLMLRPETFPRENFCTDLVRALYKTDTSTNVLPSIHVYNSICVYVAIHRCSFGKKHNLLRIYCFILTVLIIMSTVFLKQHSVIDVLTAFIMAIILYIPIYSKKFVKKKKGAEWCQKNQIQF